MGQDRKHTLDFDAVWLPELKSEPLFLLLEPTAAAEQLCWVLDKRAMAFEHGTEPAGAEPPLAEPAVAKPPCVEPPWAEPPCAKPFLLVQVDLTQTIKL